MAIDDILKSTGRSGAGGLRSHRRRGSRAREADRRGGASVRRSRSTTRSCTRSSASPTPRRPRQVNAARLEAKMTVSSVKGDGVDVGVRRGARPASAPCETRATRSLFAALAAEAFAGVNGPVTIHVAPADTDLAEKAAAASRTHGARSWPISIPRADSSSRPAAGRSSAATRSKTGSTASASSSRPTSRGSCSHEQGRRHRQATGRSPRPTRATPTRACAACARNLLPRGVLRPAHRGDRRWAGGQGTDGHRVRPRSGSRTGSRSHGRRDRRCAEGQHGPGVPKVLSFLHPSARTLLSTLLGRWDVFNIKTILRGAHNHVPLDEMKASFFPAGYLSEEELEALAQVR